MDLISRKIEHTHRKAEKYYLLRCKKDKIERGISVTEKFKIIILKSDFLLFWAVGETVALSENDFNFIEELRVFHDFCHTSLLRKNESELVEQLNLIIQYDSEKGNVSAQKFYQNFF
jgi:hypothetical protein